MPAMSSPASVATSRMKSRVAPTPIGTVFVAGWPNERSSHFAAWRRDLGIEHDVEIRVAEPCEIGWCRAHRRADVDVDAQTSEQPGNLDDIVAMPEAERSGAQQVAGRA